MKGSSNVITQFDELLASSNFLFVVYYRGHWCPFCMGYLKDFARIQEQITTANLPGKTLIVTAEPASFLPETRKTTGYTGEAIVDEENVLLEELKRRGWVDVAVTEKKGYASGMAQPAVLVVQKGGQVLESWAIVPSTMNLGGAKDRPDLQQIWDNVQAKLKGEAKVHATYKLQSIWGVISQKIFG